MRGKIKEEEEALGHFSIGLLSPSSKSDGSLAQLEWERERERCLIGCEPGAAFFFPQANHTPRRNKKRESEMHIISIWNRSAGKGTFTTPSFSFSIQLDISDYMERERTNKRAAAAHHGKCQTLMLSASHGGETEIKDDELAGGWRSSMWFIHNRHIRK